VEGGGRKRVRLAPLPAGTRLRLWISYQRYAALLLALPVAAIALAAWLAPWWIAALLALPVIAPVRFALEVASRWPRKLRATQLALHRLRLGHFHPESVRAYCGDPCFRVVAREILTRAGIPRGERRRQLAQFANELRDADRIVVSFDHRVHGPFPSTASDLQISPSPAPEEMT
jgi:hypothetical protein